MKISIITATYNSQATIQDTIKSVLSQNYCNIEHIIIDGGSTDDTLNIVRSYGDKISKIISEPDKGIYDAMNKGIKLATGDVVGLLNSDDFFNNNTYISQVVETFKKDMEIDAVYANMYYVSQNEPTKIIRYWKSKDFKKKMFFSGWHPPHPTLYIKKDIYKKYGTFDLSFNLAADFELMLRFFERHKIRTKHIDTYAVRMRLGGATSKNWENIRKQNIECVKAFKKNGFKAPLFYPLYRLMPKLLEFIKS